MWRCEYTGPTQCKVSLEEIYCVPDFLDILNLNGTIWKPGNL
jgi:hypothetical protein